MAKHAHEDTGTVGPLKQRGFPWRLWLFALVMTALAGAGGYFSWHFRRAAAAAATANSVYQAVLQPSRDEAERCRAAAAAAGQKLTQVSAEHQKLQSEREQLAKSLTGSQEARERAAAELKAVDEIYKQLAKLLEAGELKITTRRGSLVLTVAADVLFPGGAAELSKEGEIKVLEIAFNLKRFPDRRFMVLGHTDSQPPQQLGAYPDNWALSTARALTVARVLALGGVPRKNLVAAGAGEHDELVPNTSAAAMQRNRRIEIVLLPAASELPPLPPSLAEQDGSGAGAGGGTGAGSGSGSGAKVPKP